MIEHRMFSHMTMNWRGRPLVSHEAIIQLIANTTTKTGLLIRAKQDRRRYRTGIKISDEELAAVLQQISMALQRAQLRRLAAHA